MRSCFAVLFACLALSLSWSLGESSVSIGSGSTATTRADGAALQSSGSVGQTPVESLAEDSEESEQEAGEGRGWNGRGRPSTVRRCRGWQRTLQRPATVASGLEARGPPRC